LKNVRKSSRKILTYLPGITKKRKNSTKNTDYKDHDIVESDLEMAVRQSHL